MVARSAVIILLAFAASGQSLQSPPAAPIAFQLADIHKSAYSRNPAMEGGMLRGSRFEIRRANMVDLVGFAYSVDTEDVTGGPGWLEFDRFDIIAKAPEGTAPEALRRMLRTLLADRFHLVVHRETRPMPALVLSMGKDKPKLKPAGGTGDTGCHMQRRAPQPDQIPPAVLDCRNVAMATFAQVLREAATNYLDDPVVDSTGLNGSWDFTIEWTPHGLLERAGADGVSVFDALEKQLGLKLQAQRIPRPVVVVDRVDEKPTGNPPGVTTSLPSAPPSEFEVAVLKLAAADEPPGGDGIQPGGRVTFLGFPLRFLVEIAYDVQLAPEIPGAPKWFDSARYDLIAKASTSLGSRNSLGFQQIDNAAIGPMMRKLLEDRLRLTAHFEDQPVTAYTIVADKPKLKPADPTRRTGCKTGPLPRIGDGGPRLQATCQNMTMAQFADQLPSIAPVYMRHPALDATGIQGAWDFTLAFSPAPPGPGGAGGGRKGGGLAPPPAPVATPNGPGVAAEPNGGLSLFEAVEKQLGLRLEMHKRNFPVLVIDHIEEKPVEN